MIDDKLTIEEAKKHYSQDILQYNAFLYGVEWAEKQVSDIWHSVDDLPEIGERILVITAKGNLVEWISKYNTIYALNINHIARWAYAKDLVKLSQE